MPRLWKWILGVVGGILLTLVVALVVVILVFDWNWARAPITKAVATATGRDVTIGDISGEWSWTPRVTFREVEFANAEWAKEPRMFAAEELSITLDARQLLRGRLVLPEIEVVKPRLALERTAEGKSNWTFGAKQAAEVAAPENRFEMPLIGLLSIEDGTLVYRDPKSGLDLDGKISTVIGSGGGTSDRQVRVDGKGTLQGQAFNLRFTGGSLLMLRETDQPYPLAIDFTVGPSRVRLSGSLDDPIKFEGLDLKLDMQGPNLALLSKMTGVPFPLTPVYDIKARVQRDGEVWLLQDINGKMGRSDIRGTLRADVSGERPSIEADLVSSTLDYRDVGSLIGIDPAKYEAAVDADNQREAAAKAEKTPAEKDVQTSGRDNRRTRESSAAAGNGAATPPAPIVQRRVLPDAPLAVEQVRNTDARIKFRGEKVLAPNVPLSGVALDLEMKNGVLRIKPLSLGVAGGKTIAEIKIDATGKMVETEYDIRLQGYELARFLNDAGLKDAGKGKIYGRIILSGPGDTLQKSLANAHGNLRLVMYGGEISTLGMELVGADIAEALGLWAQGDKPAQIRCLAADLPVASGTVKTNFFVLDTSDSLVEIQGTADLAAERLDLRVNTYPKDPSPLSVRTPITIAGPFAKPGIGVDAGALAARAAGAIALGTLLTPLAALLAFVEPGLEKDSDCGALLQQANPK